MAGSTDGVPGGTVDGPVGFVGLGLMGQPMALNLARAGVPLLVWNRTPSRCGPALAAGATSAAGPAEVLAACEVVLLMLSDEDAVDQVLGRHPAGFGVPVAGRLLVQLGTFAPDWSRELAEQVAAAGGRYVEAPVSGSRGPAEQGRLVGMLAGEPDDVERVRGLLSPVCAETFACGAVPAALLTKLAVNVVLITLVTGLAESFHFAERLGVDAAVLQRVLDAGPMASAVSRTKAAMLTSGDRQAPAAISDVLKNNRLIAAAARGRATATPLIDVCLDLFAETEQLGHGRADMVAVLEAVRRRSGLVG